MTLFIIGTDLKDCKFQDFGEVGELLVTKDDTLLLHGKGNADHIESRCEQIIANMEDCSSGKWSKYN